MRTESESSAGRHPTRMGGWTIRYGIRSIVLSPIAMLAALVIVSELRWIPAAVGVFMLCAGFGLTMFGLYSTPGASHLDVWLVDE